MAVIAARTRLHQPSEAVGGTVLIVVAKDAVHRRDQRDMIHLPRSETREEIRLHPVRMDDIRLLTLEHPPEARRQPHIEAPILQHFHFDTAFPERLGQARFIEADNLAPHAFLRHEGHQLDDMLLRSAKLSAADHMDHTQARLHPLLAPFLPAVLLIWILYPCSCSANSSTLTWLQSILPNSLPLPISCLYYYLYHLFTLCVLTVR